MGGYHQTVSRVFNPCRTLCTGWKPVIRQTCEPTITVTFRDMPALTTRFTLADLRAARNSGAKVPMLTCYDYTTARLMQESGVPMLLVGDPAANVILAHPTPIPASRDFRIAITDAP